jgi:hypothetical protein
LPPSLRQGRPVPGEEVHLSFPATSSWSEK